MMAVNQIETSGLLDQ